MTQFMPQPKEPGVTLALAQFIVNATSTDITSEVREKAKRSFADAVGCLIGGWSDEVARPLVSYLESQPVGEGLIVGHPNRAPVESAALVNGSLLAALDYDDTVRALPGHPSGPVIAAIAAESGTRPIPGLEALEAYIVGVDVAVWVGYSLGEKHAREGWHPTGTVAIFGAVAALSRLRGLDVAQTCRGLGIAVSMAAGLKVNFGTMTKALHTGWAAHAAVEALDLAEAGLSAAPDALESPTGYVATYGEDAINAKIITDRVGPPWVFAEPGVALRLYPCHGASHKALDAALLIHADAGVSADEIATVRSYNPPPWFKWMPPSCPSTGLEGRYSFEYILATALADGYVNLTSFTDQAVARPDVRKLIERIEVFEDPAFFDESRRRDDDPSQPPYEGWVRLEVVTTDGRTFTRDVEELPGSPARPADWDVVTAKFLDLCALGGVSAEQGQTLLGQLRSIESLPDLSLVLSSVSRDR